MERQGKAVEGIVEKMDALVQNGANAPVQQQVQNNEASPSPLLLPPNNDEERTKEEEINPSIISPSSPEENLSYMPAREKDVFETSKALEKEFNHRKSCGDDATYSVKLLQGNFDCRTFAAPIREKGQSRGKRAFFDLLKHETCHLKFETDLNGLTSILFN